MIVAITNFFIMLWKQYQLYLFHLKKILVFTLVVGVFWEFITPLYMSTSVADLWDIFAYMVGGTIYWIVVLAR